MNTKTVGTLAIIAAFLVLFSACAPSPTAIQPTQIINTPTIAVPTEVFQSMNTIKISAPSLKNNLVGEAAERTIQVYLPPSYGIQDKRFPVVYYLPGYGDTSMIGFSLPSSMDRLINDGKLNEMIVVVVNGTNKLGGSFYVNSSVTGNWEDFIAQDVVGYVDGNFRTLAQSESRGITGHSMGGFGALNIAMHRPDVFGAVYSMSPGLFDENGLAESQIFDSENLIRRFIKYESGLSALPLEEAKTRMFSSPDQFTLSYGFAFAPNPDRHPPYFDYPFTEVVGKLARDDEIWKKWESGFGGIAEEAVQYKDNFLKLKGIVVDYGEYDEFNWIPKGCIHFGEQLTAAGILVKVESYRGSHQSVLGERIRDYMLPFFSKTLKFD